MAVGVGTVSADKIAAYNANKPLLLGRNMLANSTVDVTLGSGPETISACWRRDTSLSTSPLSVTASGSVTNNSDRVAHPELACDRQLSGLASPYNKTARTHALIFSCEFSNTIPIDSVIIANHNFAQIAGAGSSSSDLVVNVAVSDSKTFSSHEVIQSWTAPFTNERLVSIDLGNTGGGTGSYKSYTGVTYLQVYMYGSADIIGPQIGEVFAGPRRQLSRRPIFDTYDNDAVTNVIGIFTAKSGAQTQYGFSKGKEVQAPIFAPSGDASTTPATTDLHNLDDYATLQSFWADIDYGTHCFFFLPNVSGKKDECFFMYANEMIFPSQMISGSTSDHEVDFAFTEIAPFYSSEV